MVAFTKWMASALGVSSWMGDDAPISSPKRDVIMYQITPARLELPWAAFESDLFHQWQAGVTHSVLGFWQHGGPKHLAHYWAGRLKGHGRERTVQLAEKMGVKIILSVGGPGDYKWFKTDPKIYVKSLCEWAKTNQFHGVDFQMEYVPTDNNTAGISWLVEASKIAHDNLGYVMHTPHAKYFNNPHKDGGYGAVVLGSQNVVSKYMIRYYNELSMGYTMYDDIFGENRVNRNSIPQIVEALGGGPELKVKLGVVKAFNVKSVKTGFVTFDSLKKWYCMAEQDSSVDFGSSIGFWERDYMGSRFGPQTVNRRLVGFRYKCHHRDSSTTTTTRPALPTVAPTRAPYTGHPIAPTAAPTAAPNTLPVFTLPPATESTESTSTIRVSVPTTTPGAVMPTQPVPAVVLACRNAVLDTAPCKAACMYYYNFNKNCRNGSTTLEGLLNCVKENAGYCLHDTNSARGN